MDPQNTVQDNPLSPPIDTTEVQQSPVAQEVVNALSGAKNILITVGSNPNVDELASLLGATLLLAKIDKHTTAVFSGEIPPAIDFLDPEATFEDSVDSLRDFIIALDKEKADKLRYKVEENVVKIFITPYKSKLDKDDFEFSQGDFNVDVILALGVEKREELDKAILAHGRILHDAQVIAVNAGKTSNLGTIDWNDEAAGSIAEMLTAMSERLGSNLIDQQIANALLTGIVAATNRFSNEKTTPKVMTMSAQLMAAGANQQLIANNLRHEGLITEDVRQNFENTKDNRGDNGEIVVSHGSKKPKSDQPNDKPKNETNQSRDKSGLDQKSETKKSQDQPKSIASSNSDQPQIVKRNIVESRKEQTEEKSSDNADQLRKTLEHSAPEASSNIQQSQSSTTPTETKRITPLPAPITEAKSREEMLEKPSFGGTLNATTAEAAQSQDAQLERERSENNIALSHKTSDDESQQQQDAVEQARQAAAAAFEGVDFNPANNPVQSIGSVEAIPSIHTQQIEQAAPDSSVQEKQAETAAINAGQQQTPDPMQSFMQPHEAANSGTEHIANQPSGVFSSAPNSPSSSSSANSMPPLPPMPSGPQLADVSLPPLPPLPGGVQNLNPLTPNTTPPFMQAVGQSQNAWTEAADDLAKKQAEKEASRQEKIDDRIANYEAAVDKNRELQGLPPVNVPTPTATPQQPADHSVFPLPPQV